MFQLNIVSVLTIKLIFSLLVFWAILIHGVLPRIWLLLGAPFNFGHILRGFIIQDCRIFMCWCLLHYQSCTQQEAFLHALLIRVQIGETLKSHDIAIVSPESYLVHHIKKNDISALNSNLIEELYNVRFSWCIIKPKDIKFLLSIFANCK